MPAVSRPDVAWLASCALGLAISSMGPDRRVQEIGGAADWDPGLLEAAYREVSGSDIGDLNTRRAAAEMLLGALARARA